ncbi:MAG: hypothetical protein JJT78_13290 [Leptospira sp.]|nr:hypothetical protein [Leptospira sp.]
MIFIFGFIQCSVFFQKQEAPLAIPPINPGDNLSISKIVKRHKSGHREILATGPEAMRYIFYRAGCMDGSSLVGLLQHEWKPDSQLEKWTGACKSMKSDSIYFRITHPGNPTKYKEFGDTTLSYLRKAEEEQNIAWFQKAIEYEPALADARLNLFQSEVDKKNCKKAKRHLDIFLQLSPGFPQNYQLKSYYRKSCK